MKNLLMLILFGLYLTSCGAVFAPVTDTNRPEHRSEASAAHSGATDQETSE